MKRLTERDAQGNWALKGVNWQQLRIGQPIIKELQQKLYGALFKLMQYENTELSPDQVETLKEDNEWIPVGVAMPREHTVKMKNSNKYSDRVLVTIEFKDHQQVSIAHTKNEEWITNTWGNVAAWKPLPEPYKEDKNGKDL